MICVIIGLLLSLTYTIISVNVFAHMLPVKTVYKRKTDDIFAEYVELKSYSCYYFSYDGDKRACLSKFINLIKSQYNYNKELIDTYKDKQKLKFILTDFSRLINTSTTEDYLKITSLYDN